jgi:chromatin remodeling complex protein RSC6
MPRKEKQTKEEKTKLETVSEIVSETTQDETVTESSSSSRAPRQVHTRETVEKEFDDLITSVANEIESLREQPKASGVKFLRSLNKSLKALKSHALRISKHKTTTRRNNANSGFLKPVQISKELAKFTGWKVSEPRSRVDVTKFICDYIKQKNLQDPSDKRRICVDKDDKLRNLLGYNVENDKPLTYYSLQTYLKTHFKSLDSESKTQESRTQESKTESAPEPKESRVQENKPEKPKRKRA